MTIDQENPLREYEERLYNFFMNFRDRLSDEYKYRTRIFELPAQPRRFKLFNIDFGDLIIWDGELAVKLAEKPREMINAIQRAAHSVLTNIRPLDAEEIRPEEIHVAIRGEEAGKNLALREISSIHVGKLITVQGLLVKLSQVYLKMHKVVFQCPQCGEKEYRQVTSIGKDIDSTPPKCTQCDTGRKMEIIDEESIYKDVQYARIQERPEELPPGQIPRFIEIQLEEPLIDVAYPGEYVRVVGVLDIVKTTSRSRTQRFQFQITALSMESLGKEAVEVELTKADIEYLRKLSMESDFYDRILRSFSPSIYGYKHIKEALLLAIIGSDEIVLPDGNRIRGKIHVLLVGDPGVAKSQLLKYAAAIAPKGIYTSGRGSTAAGLTAAVIKDPGGGMSLEAGAVVLADMGICAIDEIDKMRPEDRVAIHEAMEQLTVSVSKGGIIATLNARTTILAAANPRGGRYNPHILFTENINLPPTLISRFDIIHLMRDIPDPTRDKELVQHMVKAREEKDIYEDTFDPLFLKKYILYAKKLRPSFTREAYDELINFYLKQRAKYDPETEVMPITSRQFEALLRIAEASARAHLRERVTVEDAKIAINQLQKFLRDVAYDEETQEVDVTLVQAGVPGKKASKTETILRIIREMQREVEGNPIPEQDVIKRVMEKTRIKDQTEIERILERMHKEGIIYYPQPGMVSARILDTGK